MADNLCDLRHDKFNGRTPAQQDYHSGSLAPFKIVTTAFFLLINLVFTFCDHSAIRSQRDQKFGCF